MKKGKVFKASQIALGGMVLVLCAAVWLNAKYSKGNLKDKIKYMGETAFVSKDTSEEALPTAAPLQEDYFSKALSERDKAYKNAEETAQDILNTSETDEGSKKEAADKIYTLCKRKVDETQIENLLSAKGFEKSIAVISDTGVTVAVGCDGLESKQTLQIQDIVASQCGVGLNNIKIITVQS